MTWLDRTRRSSRTDRAEDDDTPDIDPDTGEVLSAGRAWDARNEASQATAESTTIQGERAIPSVNRERSIQSRISGALALATIILLGAGFLFWYYNTQYSKTREAEEAARKAAVARAGGEMKVPPLGRIEPPRAPLDPTPVSTNPSPPPPPVPVNTANAGPPPKTPDQLALERQLGIPVLRRAQTAQPAGAPTPYASAEAATLPGGVPGMAQLLGALQAPGAAAAASPGGNLASNLKPTPTPAVAAQTLPTRRMLLPKGAFIDCTLETAIDSTYEGMTTCIGASDIYGADGKVVLLERGTKYVGEQRGTPRQGQGRVFVVWNEARTPTGVVVQLASPGTDELGRNGLPGFVDTHFWDRFGAAILISVIDGTMQALAAHQQSGTNVGSGGGVVLGPQGSRDVITEVLRSTVSIPPTVIKNQGERIQILVARDVDFRSVYALRTDSTTP
ncbi:MULTISPECIES: type IV secretion system protein VirB10 [unclassified Variovorax]|uniref:type IV secretion system protein VirB10 n=1 Tax=unclassified Variovorax TaxID=663243 RepID=UPI00076CD6AD|nr:MULTISPECIES: type IV secretion system protein VirB10 [unclassified Variovorax]KWT71748.1 Inner membrane protein forms channel for type IV secretion of T-DNA complex (VirB10) [Variovorax sp. WDL1]PNG46140.1 Type IV secretion system protein virB10 [Variovorax sp. B2]PNG46201.1 Type IV secretion system protein virB10 [Variovorax sp. B4]VTV19266.1 Type IV secretion system protein virB10 [Variovorax sp. WDL1]